MSVSFTMFSASHLAAIAFLLLAIAVVYSFRKQIKARSKAARWMERIMAAVLLLLEIGYHSWMIYTGRWSVIDSLPLELCSISLLAAIVLLWTGNRHLIDFVLFAGIGGAIQAMLTPVLDLDFPHFRYFHFFLTHTGIIMTGLYFVWVRGHIPSLAGVLKAFLLLNALVPIILVINWAVGGNYMFLREKPLNGSLLDYLGPFPWYILSLELVALGSFLLIWSLLRIGSGRLQ